MLRHLPHLELARAKVEELDVKLERRTAWDLGRGAASTVRVGRGGRDHGLFSLFHRGKCQVPRVDDATLFLQGELEGPGVENGKWGGGEWRVGSGEGGGGRGQ